MESADGGTVFLDEIGEMPFDLQVRILRLIQEGEIDKIGSTAPTKVDVRIIAATHRNLEAMVQDGSFREDLYYRLAVVPIQIPPFAGVAVRHSGNRAVLLREGQTEARPAEPQTAAGVIAGVQFLPLARQRASGGEPDRAPDRACDGNAITVDDLPEAMRPQAVNDDLIRIELPPQGLDLEAVEKELIAKALDKFGGNQTRAAAYLPQSEFRLQPPGSPRPPLSTQLVSRPSSTWICRPSLTTGSGPKRLISYVRCREMPSRCATSFIVSRRSLWGPALDCGRAFWNDAHGSVVLRLVAFGQKSPHAVRTQPPSAATRRSLHNSDAR